MRTIEKLIAPAPPHFVGDGFRVHNFIPNGGGMAALRMDPFILLDYNSRYRFAPSGYVRGVGVHPHRGFETVTIAYKGAVAHHDSTGNSGVIHEGDVQWMTAGSGILHKEYHEESFSKTGGDFQMVQLWVNLPARFKKTAPGYQALQNETINRYVLSGDQGAVEVIAGQYEGVKGSARTFSPLHVLNARLQPGATARFGFPASFNTALLVIEGQVVINGTETVPTDHFALFRNDDPEFILEATSRAVVLVLSGEPLNEPVVQHGPFVMNTREEIYQSIRDFNLGKFGYLED